MIRHLKLEGWRAFESVDLAFDEGTTFVVAPNGVGKTSLLLGLAWAVFGEHSDIDPKQHIRLGHDRTEVTATVVADQTEIVIHRTATSKGRHSSTYEIDGQPVDREVADSAIADLLGAPPSIAAKLATIRSAGSEPLDIEDHLFDAFGVSDLQQAAGVAERLHKDAVKARKTLRSESRQVLDNRDQLQADGERLRREVEERNALRKTLTDRIQLLSDQQRVVEEWQSYRDALKRHEEQVRQLIERSAGSARDLDELATHVNEQVSRIQAEQKEADAALDAAKSQRLAAVSALQLLEGQHPACPTCARPFDGNQLDSALEAQRRSAQAAIELAEAIEGRLDKINFSLQQALQLQAEIEDLRIEPPSPSTPLPTEDPTVQRQATEEELRKHDEGTGRLTSRLSEIADALADDDAVRQAQEQEAAAWRREAMTQATAMSLRAAADRIANEQIAPLSDQVRWRWKALFGDDGLQLRADGTIVRRVGERELPWEQLSGGERIWARLVAGLLVVQASTKLPFAWIDEPLEHLDPRARRVVAADLADAPSRGGPRQLIVTSYEHAIIRQISADTPDASMLVVNHSPRP